MNQCHLANCVHLAKTGMVGCCNYVCERWPFACTITHHHIKCGYPQASFSCTARSHHTSVPVISRSPASTPRAPSTSHSTTPRPQTLPPLAFDSPLPSVLHSTADARARRQNTSQGSRSCCCPASRSLHRLSNHWCVILFEMCTPSALVDREHLLRRWTTGNSHPVGNLWWCGANLLC